MNNAATSYDIWARWDWDEITAISVQAMLGQYLYHLACSTMYGILGTILHRDTAGVSLEAAIAQEGSVKGSRLPRTSSRPQLASV